VTALPQPRPTPDADPARDAALARLGARAVVLVGMMGSGKTSVGRRLAARLDLPFVDADAEIEAAAGMSIPDIFATRGEDEFRAGEVRVVARLLDGGPRVVATGGGAFMNPVTRANVAAKGVSVWLRAEFDVLMRRVRKRSNRPLLQTADPEATLRRLIDERYPTYALADVTVDTGDAPHESVVDHILAALARGPADRPAATVETIRVDVADRPYDILIGPGLIDEAGDRIEALRPGAAVAVVTDENVARAHGARLAASLDRAGLRHVSVVAPPGEASKSWVGLERVVSGLLAARIERRDLVLALGGGVVGDLAGFAAGVLRRGVDFVQLPTSLLAQVDSSVGGKTGISTPEGKNLVGLFHQPALVLADTSALDTLPPREFRAGYAEVAKYGLLGDAAFFATLERDWREVFDGGPARAAAIAASCRAKAAIVARDEREAGDRALLNLGHTFGHALEAATGYGQRLLHGEAVAIGMALAFRFSARRGLCDAAAARRVETHLAAVGLPTRLADVAGGVGDLDRLLDAIRQDKKVERGRLAFVLVRGVGQAFLARDVDETEVRAFLAEELRGADAAG
jgi:shikimate kinase/3-dehydroquinate synthase